MHISVDEDGDLILDGLFLGTRLFARESPHEIIVVQRDGELLIRLSDNGGKSWTDWTPLKDIFKMRKN